jgi:hypothetical protein
VRIIPGQEKWPTQGRPFPCRSDIRKRKQKQFSRPMTGHTPQKLPFFRRNLLHHRSARAECPYTRSIMIPLFRVFVKNNFRKNHKFFNIFLYISQIVSVQKQGLSALFL